MLKASKCVFRSRLEGVNCRPIPCRNHCGASRRENFDTPPLKGSCRYTKVNLHNPKGIR
jgi:hypothetical protein